MLLLTNYKVFVILSYVSCKMNRALNHIKIYCLSCFHEILFILFSLKKSRRLVINYIYIQSFEEYLGIPLNKIYVYKNVVLINLIHYIYLLKKKINNLIKRRVLRLSLKNTNIEIFANINE